MNMSNKTNFDLLPEVIALMSDAMGKIESDMAQLARDPSYTELLREVFRDVHSIKGNFAMCQSDELTQFAHHIENILTALLEVRITCTPLIAEAILMALDRLKEMSIQLSNAHALSGFNTLAVELALDDLSSASLTNAGVTAQRAIDLISGITAPAAAAIPTVAAVDMRTIFPQDREEDLQFFRELSKVFDGKNPYWEGRTQFQMVLAMGINRQSSHPVDEAQLAVAVYMHDFGMALLPESLVQKVGKYDESELEGIQRHVNHSGELLRRMPYWQEAALMVLQHHERPDGLGYPAKLTDTEIVDGAKILAIVDAFYAMTNLRADRDHKKSLMRAVTEINACSGSQFSAKWVEVFNHIAMQQIRAQNAAAAAAAATAAT